jgi:hypothetical protein
MACMPAVVHAAVVHRSVPAMLHLRHLVRLQCRSATRLSLTHLHAAHHALTLTRLAHHP